MKTGTRLLLVEDDASNALTLEALLEDEGWEVVWASSVRDAAQRLQEEARFDACVLDRGLGGDDGLSLLDPIHEHSPGVRVILLSGETRRVVPAGAEHAGVAAYVEKGLDFSVLVDALRAEAPSH